MNDFKYLAIKNWEKYQPGRAGKSSWIKDSTDKEFDAEYMGLTFFVRYVLDGCQRLRGRMGKNVPNDPKFIARALHAMSTDRPHIAHAINTLISQGFLVLTNEQVDLDVYDKNKSKNKNKDVEKEKHVSAEASSAQEPIEAIILLPLNVGEFAVTDKDFKIWTQLYPAVDVMQQLRNMAGWCHANIKKRKTKDGIKRFINSWLAKSQNNPQAASNFKNGAGNGSTSKTSQRNIGNLQALIPGAMGNSVRGDDVHHGRPVQPGTVRGREGPTITVPNGQTVEGKPERPDPASNA